MTLSQLRQLVRAMCPGAKVNVIDNTTVDLIINEGVKDIAAYTVCLKANKKFAVTADQSEYSLSTVIADYLAVDKSGLWWNNGTQYQPVYPRTLKWLDENKPTWRNLGAASPYDYTIDGDILTVVPKPQTTLTNGFWLYYGKKPTAMSADGHYPFSGSATEWTHLSIFDMAIIKYAKWVIEPILNKDQDANLSYQEYIREREEKKNLFYQRKDIAHSSDVGLRGPSVRA